MPKLRLVGESVADRPANPLPLSVIFCGLLATLSVMVIVPVLAPAAVGVKVTLMVQLVPPARLLPQVLVSAKSPPGTMLAMVNAMLPVFARVICCAAVVPPMPSSGKARLKLVRLKPGASFGLIFATNASSLPPGEFWKLPGVSRKLEVALPVT